MALKPGLHQRQRQAQALAMTPELQQAIRLLQMSNLELQAFIAAELETNPLLELAEIAEPEERRAANREQAEPATSASEVAAPRETLTEAFSRDAPSEERIVEMGVDPSEMFDGTGPSDQPAASATGDMAATPADASSWTTMSGGAAMGGAGGRGVDDGLPGIEATVSGVKSLRQYLMEQMELSIAQPARRLIAEQLIAHLDSDGYLREPLENIAERLGASLEEVEDVLHTLQALDPPGVFARDLAECFRLQLADQGALDAPMAALLDHLDLLAERDFERLASVCGVPIEALPTLAARLRRLDPRPGASHAGDPVQVVVPDVFVRAAPDGSWLVELNQDTLPRVLVNNEYRALVKASATRREDREFISECASRAGWLVKSLQQRARTILAVAREIVRRQDAFLARGVSGLKPLTLRQVAESLGLHESTISRVVANKYMATPRGIFEFRYFFTTAIASTSGDESISAEAVRHRVRELIDAEDPDKVLSDDAIVKILRKEGVDIARRTVAKYREALGIPSSPKRRREKRMLLKARE